MFIKKKFIVKCFFNVVDCNKCFIFRKVIIILKSLYGDQREVVGYVFIKYIFKLLLMLEKGR